MSPSTDDQDRTVVSDARQGPDGARTGPDVPGDRRLVVDGVQKEFLTGKTTTVALNDIDLEIEEGEFVALVGPSGCGKSTLLNIIAGFAPSTSGSVRLGDTRITGPGPERGVLFQDYALFPWRTVKGNVEFGLRHGLRSLRPSPAERDERVRTFIDLVGLTGSEGKFPSQLSGGMRQRTALARLWVMDPEVLLMDEPLAALDAQTRLVMQEELLRIWGQDGAQSNRKTVIYVTHAIDEAVFMADRIAVMGSNPGRIKAVLDVGLGRPRTEDTRATSEYDEIYRSVWELVRDEAYRAAQ